jgi:hypothetical protein
MTREQVQALMREIGPIADLAGVGEFEERDVWVLAVDDELLVDAELDAGRGCLVLSADLGDLGPADRSGRMELMLRYNDQWPDTAGARLALAAPEGPVVLLADHPIAGLEVGELARRVLTFAGMARAWRELLAAGAGDGASGSPDELGRLGFLAGGAIRG